MNDQHAEMHAKLGETAVHIIDFMGKEIEEAKAKGLTPEQAISRSMVSASDLFATAVFSVLMSFPGMTPKVAEGILKSHYKVLLSALEDGRFTVFMPKEA